MRYYVTMQIEGRYTACVDADSVDDARAEAFLDYCDADFGDLEIVHREDIIVENENGDFVWEHA